VAEITIGRSQGNDIILGSKTVSRRHAILKIMGDRVLVVNQSPNGLLVGAERVDHVRELGPGEVITLDVYRITVDGIGAGPGVAPLGPAPMPAVSGPSPYGMPQGVPPGPPPGVAGPVMGPSIGVNVGMSAPVMSVPVMSAPVMSAPVMSAPVMSAPVVPQPQAGTAQPRVAPKPEMPRSKRVKRTPEQEQASFQEYIKKMFPHAGQEEPRVNLSGAQVQTIDRKRRAALVEFKSKLHDELKERLDLHSFEITDYRNPRVIRQVSAKLKELLEYYGNEVPPPFTKDDVFKELMDEVCGLGPIEDLVKHKKVSEIMVVDRDHVYAELGGKIVLTDRFFNDAKSMMTVIERIVVPRGRRIDESTPLVDTRLADGSRVNAVIPPLALKDPCLTIRKFPESRLSIEDLVRFNSMTIDMAKFIGRAVRIRKNIIISGGTGSGKTTLLNVMSSFIGPRERVVTIEDAAELQLQQEHVVSLETKPPNLEGKGEISIRDLVKNALRMRPDRVVVGECRGGEALDMLQAMNTGHDGSMTTIHSNSPIEAISRLETLVLMSGMELPTRAIREQIANSVNLIVQQTRFSDGSRRITYISEVVGIDDDGFIRIEDIFRYKQTGMNEKGKVQGYHMATGYLPTFLYDFVINGVATEDDFF
jgi:pilus assembly protein CpaF